MVPLRANRDEEGKLERAERAPGLPQKFQHDNSLPDGSYSGESRENNSHKKTCFTRRTMCGIFIFLRLREEGLSTSLNVSSTGVFPHHDGIVPTSALTSLLQL